MVSTEHLTPRQRQTAAARAAFDAKFPDPESRRTHFRELAAKSAETRAGGLVLSADEATALHAAYELLGEIARRVRPQ